MSCFALKLKLSLSYSIKEMQQMNEYKRLRKKIGTQVVVSNLLGLSVQSISKRENNRVNVINEHILALKQLIKIKG